VVRGNIFDGGTHGATITTGNSGGASGDAFNQVIGAPQYSNVQAHGGLAAVNPSAGVDTHLDWSAVAQPGDTFCARGYLWLAAATDAAQRVFVLLGPGATVVSAVWMWPDRLINVYAGFSTTLATTLTVPIPLQQWVRVEFRWTIDAAGDGTVETWLYLSANSSTHTEYAISAVIAWPNGKPEGVEWHLQRDGGYWYLDDVAIAPEKIGSISPEVSAPVGQVAESDVAQPVGRHKLRGIGRPVETDAAQPIARRKARALGQAVETDTATAAASRKLREIGAPAETDTAQPVSRRKTRMLGQAAQAETALPIASALVGMPVPLVVETDAALPITGGKVRAVGQAVEADTAAAITTARRLVLGQAVEADTAGAVASRKVHAVGQAVEVDIAPAIISTALGVAGDIEQALPIIPVLYVSRPMQAGPPHTHWSASTPRTRWAAGRPRIRWSSTAH
jgi:hypothetical protein